MDAEEVLDATVAPKKKQKKAWTFAHRTLEQLDSHFLAEKYRKSQMNRHKKIV